MWCPSIYSHRSLLFPCEASTQPPPTAAATLKSWRKCFGLGGDPQGSKNSSATGRVGGGDGDNVTGVAVGVMVGVTVGVAAGVTVVDVDVEVVADAVGDDVDEEEEAAVRYCSVLRVEDCARILELGGGDWDPCGTNVNTSEGTRAGTAVPFGVAFSTGLVSGVSIGVAGPAAPVGGGGENENTGDVAVLVRSDNLTGVKSWRTVPVSRTTMGLPPLGVGCVVCCWRWMRVCCVLLWV